MESGITRWKCKMLELLSDLGRTPMDDVPHMYLSEDEYSYFCTLGDKIVYSIPVNFITFPYDLSYLIDTCQIFCLERFTIKKQESLETNYTLAKTCWPISVANEMFLPEFKIRKSFLESNFKIIGRIGRGSFGKVYKILERNTGRLYAAKLMQKSQVILENAVQQAKDELTTHKACGHHEFIVNCSYAWQTHSSLVIVTEFKTGGDLLQLLSKYSFLSEETVKLFVAEISIAIDFLHNIGIIHRDLKPENVLLDENCHIYLTDFGLSKWLSRGFKTHTICGTRKYTAPEIERGEPYSHSSDWWSLGVITCRLLTNQYPIVTNKVSLPKNRNLSVPAKDLLLRLLALDPSRRLRTLFSLKTIPFFKNYNFDDVLTKKINPTELLRQCEINEKNSSTNNVFADFDKQIVEGAADEETISISYMAEKLKSNVVTSV